MTEEKKNGASGLSRREFLKDAGLLVGGAAIGSTVLLSACGGENTTETVTQTKTANRNRNHHRHHHRTGRHFHPDGNQYSNRNRTRRQPLLPYHPTRSPVNMTINNEEYQVAGSPRMVPAIPAA